MNRTVFTCVVALCLATVGNVGAQPMDALTLGWRRVGPAEAIPLYAIQLDTAVKHSGVASLRIRFNPSEPSDFGTVVSQSFLADEFRGRRIRLTAYARTHGATGTGRLWMRIDGSAEGTPFDNMSDRPITGTMNWRPYELVLHVPPDATVIHIGAIFASQGTLWIDSFRLEVVDPSVAQTGTMRERQDRTPPGKDLLRLPVNLGFDSVPPSGGPRHHIGNLPIDVFMSAR